MQTTNEATQKSAQDKLRLIEVKNSLEDLSVPSSKDSLCLTLLLINFAIFYLRPQDVISPLGSIKIPLIFNVIAITIWLINSQRNWTKQNIMIVVFLFVELLRLVAGKYIYDPFVTNDSNQFQSIKSIALETFGLGFPLTILLVNSRAIQKFLKVFNFTGLLLAIFVITHGGRGPGGFLGDENDAGLAILFFMSYPLISIFNKNPFQKRYYLQYILNFIYFLAIIATASRGTLVGLAAMLFICFLLSKSKLKLILLAFLTVSAIIPFLSREYIEDVKSISKTDEGTAKIRQHYWKLTTRVFLDPKNTLFGVGMNNLTYHLSDYENADDLEKFPSAAGRAVHSIYFEVLGDLGLWGMFLFVFFVGTAVKDNFKNYRAITSLAQDIETEYYKIESKVASDQTLLDKKEIWEECIKKMSMIRPVILTGSMMYVAIFSAGAFISVFYYPLFWTAIGFNSALSLYATRLNKTAEESLLLA